MARSARSVARSYKGRYAEGVARQPNINLSALARACAGYQDVCLVALFGSVATATARADSDVDVGVLGGGFWDQLGVGGEAGKVLGREPHVVDIETASDWLRFQVARDGVLVYERGAGVWIEFKASAMVRYWDLSPTIARCAAGVRERLVREAHGHG